MCFSAAFSPLLNDCLRKSLKFALSFFFFRLKLKSQKLNLKGGKQHNTVKVRKILEKSSAGFKIVAKKITF